VWDIFEEEKKREDLSHQTRELLEMMSGKKGEGNEQNSD
jgi:hypothetical protein